MKWIKRNPSINYDKNENLLETLGKIRDIDNIYQYIYPEDSELHSYKLLTNIDMALNRIIKAINDGENIIVLGDSDADGVTSLAIMYKYLSNFTDNITYQYYQRSESHGLEDKEFPLETDLLIAVDSSTNDIEECKKISKNMDIIIIDHHIQEKLNPYAIVINNNCINSKYPNKFLSGAGMCWKVIKALDSLLNVDLADYYLDLSAIGIIGDVMNLDELENRYIIYQGINTINNLGIKLLLKKANKTYDTTAQDIAFSIVPVLNACSRMNQIEKAIDLLLCDDEDEAKKIVKEVTKLNDTRKLKQQTISDEIEVDDSHKIIFCIENKIASNMRGLIATQLTSKYKRPAIVVKLEKDAYEGSARGYGNMQFKSLINQTGLLNFAQGHENSFGLSINKNKVNNFLIDCDKLLENVKEQPIIYDLEFNDGDLDEDIIKEIEIFNNISGKGFDPIRTKINGLMITDKKVIGKQEDTIKISTDELDLMKFKVDSTYAEDIDVFDEVNVVGVPNLNKWYNFGIRQLIISKQIFIDDYIINN